MTLGISGEEGASALACLLFSTSEPSFLLYGELRDPRTYLAILRAIGSGHHTLSEVANAALVGESHLTTFVLSPRIARTSPAQARAGRQPLRCSPGPASLARPVPWPRPTARGWWTWTGWIGNWEAWGA